jgi:hydrogenase maturation protein HypF
MACAWLVELDGAGAAPPAGMDVPAGAWSTVARMAATGFQSPVTSSMGRLFDAVAALAGVRAVVNYEGQAAIELEAACNGRSGVGRSGAGRGGAGRSGVGIGLGLGPRGPYPIAVAPGSDGFVLDPRETIAAVRDDVRARVDTGVIAARFHAAIAAGTERACRLAASARGIDTVVLSGGVFLNRRLLESTAAGLHAAGLRVLVPEKLPPGDGGISFGQAAVAAAQLRGSSS